MIGYLVTAALSASAGFFAGAFMAVSKVSFLHERLDAAEQGLRAQAGIIADLTNAMRQTIAMLEQRASANSGAEIVALARQTLADCETRMTGLRGPGDSAGNIPAKDEK